MVKAAFGGIALLGLATAVFGVYFIFYGNEAASWPETQGTVVAAAVRTRTSSRLSQSPSQRDRSRQFYPFITYRWTVNGQTYTGSRYRIGANADGYYFDEREKAQEEVDRQRPGSAIPVFYDPDDPSAAVLLPDASGGIYVPLPLGLLMLAFGVLGVKAVPTKPAAVR
jgi:hypothetical protein